MPEVSGAGRSQLYEVLLEFWRWWRGELAALLPAPIRNWRPPRPLADVHLTQDTVTIERVVDGVGERHIDDRPLEALDGESWDELRTLVRGTRTRFILGAPFVHFTLIDLPVAASGRVAGAIELQLDQISPVDPALVAWRHHVAARRLTQISVEVAFVRKSKLDEVAMLCRANDLELPSLAASYGHQIFEFERGYDDSRLLERRDKQALWGAVVLVATIPFTILFGAWWMQASAGNRMHELDALLAPKLAAEHQAARDERLRRALAPLAAPSSASATIETFASMLPSSASLQSLERNSRSLQFVMRAKDPETIVKNMNSAGQLGLAAIVDEKPINGDDLLATVQVQPRR